MEIKGKVQNKENKKSYFVSLHHYKNYDTNIQ